MLNNIIKGCIEIVISAFQFFCDSFLQMLGCDMGLLLTTFPAIQALHQILFSVGLALLILNVAWQLFRTFALPMGTMAEDPIPLLFRAGFFLCLIFLSGSIMNMVLRMIQLPYEAILGIPTEEYSVGDKIVSSIESLLGGDLANLEIGYSIIGVIFLIMVAANLFKIILSAVERYVTLGILVYTCPLAFAMGATQTTLPIFTSWCRGLGGQGVVLLLSVWCLKVIFSAFQANVENGGQLIWLLLILAFMKACQKLEGHISKLGLSVSSTGGSILNEAGSTYMGIMVAARSASKGYHKIQKRFNPEAVGAKSPGMSGSQNKKPGGASSDKAGGGQQSGGSADVVNIG